MGEEFQASKPIYIQIVDKINQQIARGELLPGNKLPSVREMAIQTGVNPNTIQRTYSELERMEIVETKRGQGTFVTENTNQIKDLKAKLQMDIIEAFFNNMKELGFSEEEMVSGLQFYIKGKREG
ncbi:GntR family transcriptional regulator [Bacillus sp. DTU_2020_1000418_1_SI_GHA_SEK_038]|uniref:GntR family transcriptional regulator n=1 Tax=Bacillus sp. DTU_2020_1000418_1_SI_GHA_SEK_038 TaxID=3077585 RepID=UPI0028ED6006|nr:GntR family transcriptional regulator [Bacillus sp. DTU_2020_1000418_1_SI_GHA_SEK_038]WNS74411.1 GntR family transcriptional regulator [Bacillus sp. DTU_2020_1000418_1_SI_GHA_SEK_038]